MTAITNSGGERPRLFLHAPNRSALIGLAAVVAGGVYVCLPSTRAPTPTVSPIAHHVRAVNGNAATRLAVPIPAQDSLTSVQPLSQFAVPHILTVDERQTLNFRRQVQQHYGPLVDGLTLSPESRHHLKELLADRTYSVLEARRLLREANVAPVDIDRGVAMATRTVDVEIRAIVGAEAFGDLMFASTSDTYAQLRSGFYLDAQFSNVPVTGTQLVRLARSVEAHAATANMPGDEAAGAGARLSTGDEAAYDDAAAFLTPGQLAVLRDYFLSRHP